jgi:hypothetical protein
LFSSRLNVVSNIPMVKQKQSNLIIHLMKLK